MGSAPSSFFRRVGKNRHAYLFLAPKLLVFLALMLVPFLATVVMSFQTGGILQNLRFTGFRNYINIMRDPVFWVSIQNTFVYTAIVIAGSLVLSLLVASQLIRIDVLKSFFRACIIFPALGSLVVVSAIWRMMLFPKTGIIPSLFTVLGLKTVNWFGDQRLALVTVGVVDIWWGVGFYSMIFLAALRAIPGELYDSAKIDGAGYARTFFRISLPLIKPSVLFVLVMATIWNLQAFDLIYTMTHGGPGYATTTIVYYIYQKAFRIDDMGKAAMMSVAILIIVFAITLLQFRAFRSELEY
jgi:ABC-type sugar transport system permease subunit